MTQADELRDADAYAEILKSKREQVLAELADLRAQATEIAAQLSTKESQLHNLSALLALEGTDVTDGTGAGAIRLSGAKPGRFIDAAWALLEQNGEPMHYRELTNRLATEGVVVPGTNPAANLIAHMSRDQRFGRAEARGIYGLAEWPAIRAATAARQGRIRPERPRRRPGRHAA